MGILGGSDIERINESAIAPLENNIDSKLKEKINSTIGTDKEKPLNKLSGTVVDIKGETMYPIITAGKEIIPVMQFKTYTLTVMLVDEKYLYLIDNVTKDLLKYDRYSYELVNKNEGFSSSVAFFAHAIDDNYIYLVTSSGYKVWKVNKETLVVEAQSTTLVKRPDILLQDSEYLYGITGTSAYKIDKQTLLYSEYTITNCNSRTAAIDNDYIYYGNNKALLKLNKSLEMVSSSGDLCSTTRWSNIFEYGDCLYASEYPDTGSSSKILQINKSDLTKKSESSAVYTATDLCGVDEDFVYSSAYNTTYLVRNPCVLGRDTLTTVATWGGAVGQFYVPKVSNRHIFFNISTGARVLVIPDVVKGYIKM